MVRAMTTAFRVFLAVAAFIVIVGIVFATLPPPPWIH